MSTDRERGVDRLIDLAERALAAGDEERAYSLASQARALSPGDVRVRKLFDADADIHSKHRWHLLWIGMLVMVAALVVAGVAIAIGQ